MKKISCERFAILEKYLWRFELAGGSLPANLNMGFYCIIWISLFYLDVGLALIWRLPLVSRDCEVHVDVLKSFAYLAESKSQMIQ
jgi:hypothetical protein